MHRTSFVLLILITTLSSINTEAEEDAAAAFPYPVDILLPDDYFIHIQTLKPQNNIALPDKRVEKNTLIKNGASNAKQAHSKENSNETIKFYLGSHLQPSSVEQFSTISAIVPTDKDNENFLISPTLGFRFYISPHLVFDAQTDLGYFKFSASEFQNLFDAPSTLYLKDETVPLRTDATLKFLF